MSNHPIIIGTGSIIPEQIIDNNSFLDHDFFDSEGNKLPYENDVIIEKFQAITGIKSRRYADDGDATSDLGTVAAIKAIKDAGIDAETIDQLIVAHNFADVHKGNLQADILPSIASRIKHNLGIENPDCVAYDLLFGCPGWLQGIIQSNAYISSGMAKTCLIIGAETLSRVVDIHDRDSMIYADGAGACILQKNDGQNNRGILSSASQSFTKEEAYYLYSGHSFSPKISNGSRFIKMHGRKIYEFALNNVPTAMKVCFDKSGEDIKDLKKVLIHQANDKMDIAIVKRFYKLYGYRMVPENALPMSISKLGNSSVATIPTLYDLILKDQCADHQLTKGDLVLFASVGSGMNINAITYRL